MTLQEMFNKAQEHFAQMDRPSMSTRSENGGSNCAYRGHEANKCIVGAFIDDEHYKPIFEGKGVLEWDSKRGVQPVLNAVAATWGVHGLDDQQIKLLYDLQLIHDDHSDRFDIGVDNWYEVIEADLIDLALKSGLDHNVG